MMDSIVDHFSVSFICGGWSEGMGEGGAKSQLDSVQKV